jgi:hypothetical protein
LARRVRDGHAGGKPSRCPIGTSSPSAIRRAVSTVKLVHRRLDGRLREEALAWLDRANTEA